MSVLMSVFARALLYCMSLLDVSVSVLLGLSRILSCPCGRICSARTSEDRYVFMSVLLGLSCIVVSLWENLLSQNIDE